MFLQVGRFAGAPRMGLPNWSDESFTSIQYPYVSLSDVVNSAHVPKLETVIYLEVKFYLEFHLKINQD